ncbi:transmembrane protein 269 isoform X2 [Engraulis encrasicolus]|uniref:transmembrane protein 269 isoform X2 n=1 Tax=Engraulis encrasicolus TaxID=184585 RepID=UPI002FD4111D
MGTSMLPAGWSLLVTFWIWLMGRLPGDSMPALHWAPVSTVIHGRTVYPPIGDGGAKLDDFADFTTFGIATSLLLRTESLLDNILCMCYVLSVFTRLCFFSSGIPFMYRGLPCIYSSAILACVSLLCGGNIVALRITAVAMILFMISHNFYPHDRVLESQAWKKVIYAGGVAMVFCSSFPPACVYYLLWSMSYILFPTSLWSCKV